MSGDDKKKKSEKKVGGFNQPFGALKELKKKLEQEEQAKKDALAAGKAPPKSPAQPPSARPNKPKPLTPLTEEQAAEEALSFHRMMSGVTPLDHSRVRLPTSQAPVERSPAAAIAEKRAHAVAVVEAEAAAVHEHLRTLVEGKARFELSDDGRRVEGRRVDLPIDSLRKLRRGLLPIDARIDLHGLRGGEARAAVEKFLRDKRERGERCVLVVHGKGEHSPAGIGVLRGEVAAWLSQGPASEHVAAFATAGESDGGEGAIYVLLRR